MSFNILCGVLVTMVMSLALWTVVRRWVQTAMEVTNECLTVVFG